MPNNPEFCPDCTAVLNNFECEICADSLVLIDPSEIQYCCNYVCDAWELSQEPLKLPITFFTDNFDLNNYPDADQLKLFESNLEFLKNEPSWYVDNTYGFALEFFSSESINVVSYPGLPEYVHAFIMNTAEGDGNEGNKILTDVGRVIFNKFQRTCFQFAYVYVLDPFS